MTLNTYGRLTTDAKNEAGSHANQVFCVVSRWSPAARWRWTGTVHPDLASGFRLGGSSEHDDAGYDDPPEDEDGSRCRRTPPNRAIKLRRVVTEEHGWDKCEVD